MPTLKKYSHCILKMLHSREWYRCKMCYMNVTHRLFLFFPFFSAYIIQHGHKKTECLSGLDFGTTLLDLCQVWREICCEKGKRQYTQNVHKSHVYICSCRLFHLTRAHLSIPSCEIITFALLFHRLLEKSKWTPTNSSSLYSTRVSLNCTTSSHENHIAGKCLGKKTTKKKNLSMRW